MNKRRMTAVLCLAVLLVSLLAGCGSEGLSMKEKKFVGTWEPVDDSTSRYWRFLDNGKCLFWNDSEEAEDGYWGEWSVDGDILIVFMADQRSWIFEITGKTLEHGRTEYEKIS